MPNILARFAIIAALAGAIAAGEAALPTPEAFLADVIGKPQLRSATGEQYTWFAAFYAHDFLSAYEATRDPAWLAAAQTYYDAT